MADEAVVEKEADGKVQVSFRLYPEQVAALNLYSTLTGNATGPVGQNRWRGIVHAFANVIPKDKTLKPFEERLTPITDVDFEPDWEEEEE